MSTSFVTAIVALVEVTRVNDVIVFAFIRMGRLNNLIQDHVNGNHRKKAK
jgi:hypothetical protein